MIKPVKARSLQQQGNQSGQFPFEQPVGIDEVTRITTMNLFPQNPAEQQA
jgi:hypothetical protein